MKFLPKSLSIFLRPPKFKHFVLGTGFVHGFSEVTDMDVGRVQSTAHALELDPTRVDQNVKNQQQIHDFHQRFV